MRTTIILLLVFISPILANAQETISPVKVLTFEECYRKVESYYPKLKEQASNIDLATTRKSQASAGYFPRFQASVAATRGDDPVYVFGSLLREGAFSAENFALDRLNTPRPHTNYNVSVTGQIPIFDAMQTISRVRWAKSLLGSARDEESFTKMEALLLAAEAYLHAVSIDKLLVNLNEVQIESQKDIEQAENLKEKGLILGVDFYAAKIAFGNITVLQNQVLQEKQAAHTLLNILMGQDPSLVFNVTGEMGQMDRDTRSLTQWFEDAYQLRLDLASLEKIIRAQNIDIEREKFSGYPRIDAFGEVREDTRNFSSDGGQNYIVGVKATVDLLDPTFSARVRGSQAALRKLQHQKTTLKDSIAKDLANEFAYYQTVEDNFPVNQQMLADAKTTVDLMLPLYREGRKSIADLLDARSAYLNVAQNYYTLATNRRASWTRLLFLSGQLEQSRINSVISKKGE